MKESGIVILVNDQYAVVDRKYLKIKYYLIEWYCIQLEIDSIAIDRKVSYGLFLSSQIKCGILF